jgi:hypothetical protein
MAKPTRDPHDTVDRPGLKPLLQGHLKPGGVRPRETPSDAGEARASADERSAQPAEDVATSPNEADAVTGKATKSPADVATRPHLEGSEQGPA